MKIKILLIFVVLLVWGYIASLHRNGRTINTLYEIPFDTTLPQGARVGSTIKGTATENGMLVESVTGVQGEGLKELLIGEANVIMQKMINDHKVTPGSVISIKTYYCKGTKSIGGLYTFFYKCYEREMLVAQYEVSK